MIEQEMTDKMSYAVSHSRRLFELQTGSRSSKLVRTDRAAPLFEV